MVSPAKMPSNWRSSNHSTHPHNQKNRSKTMSESTQPRIEKLTVDIAIDRAGVAAMIQSDGKPLSTSDLAIISSALTEALAQRYQNDEIGAVKSMPEEERMFCAVPLPDGVLGPAELLDRFRSRHGASQ
jgi:flagellar biosynthesis/type III secretory pathway M-ring protein FliF/YscJ